MIHTVGRVFVVLALVCLPGGDSRASPPAPAALPPLEAMIGQMLIVGFDGQRPGEPGVRRVVRQLEQGLLGGVILMDRNIRSPEQVRKLTSVLAGAAAKLPPLIGIDQEGGRVQRLSSRKGFRAYPAARLMARDHGPLSAYYVYRGMAEELARAGFNLNFGPVVDLNLNASNHIINGRGRSFGADPGLVATYAQAFIAAHRDVGILTSLKHFPGHGSSAGDSHTRFVDLTESWNERELAPYRALAAERAIDTVMVGHLYHPSFSQQRLPATLAPGAIAWLRDDLDFDGVIVTDDLGMGAISKHYTVEQSLVRAVAAGNDVLLIANLSRKAGFAANAIAVIRAAVDDGRIPLARIVASYRRIVALKGALQERAPKPPAHAAGPD